MIKGDLWFTAQAGGTVPSTTRMPKMDAVSKEISPYPESTLSHRLIEGLDHMFAL